MIELTPRTLEEVICATPGIWANCFSSGVVTDDAMVTGSAPGSCVVTWMVGKSTCGSGATGRNGYATAPTMKMPDMSRKSRSAAG